MTTLKKSEIDVANKDVAEIDVVGKDNTAADSAPEEGKEEVIDLLGDLAGGAAPGMCTDDGYCTI